MLSYLAERKQYVQVQYATSECLLTGPRSVVQGSTLSGVFYLIYMLDLPYISHNIIHGPEDYRNCKEPNMKTFVDNCMAKVTAKPLSTLENDVLKFMDKVEDYASANRLAINPEKMKVVVITKNKEIKSNFKITLKGKMIKHSPEVNILGLKISDDLMWERHVLTNLLPQIKN